MFGRITGSKIHREKWPPVGSHATPWQATATRARGGHHWQVISASGGLGAVSDAIDDSANASEPSSETPNDDIVERRRRTEAVLLFHRGPVPLRKLAQLAGLADATEARTLLRQLNTIYDKTSNAFRVEEVAGGYQLLTRPGLAPWLRRFSGAPPSVRISSPAMETLAIVAYRQPILRANIEAIRGVACGEILRQLMQRDLVRICGRSEELGRPYLYGTTKHFLQTFGLKDAQTLPIMTGASVPDESDDTCANSTDQDQVEPSASPIDPTNPSDISLSAISSFDAVTQKESDVSTACVLNDPTDPLSLAFHGAFDAASAELSSLSTIRDPRAIDDEDEEFFDDDDDDDDDDVVDDDDDDWDDDDDEEEDEEETDDVVDADEDEEEEWEEVGDEEEDEVKDDDEEESEDDEEEEDDDWDDDEDEDWDDDDDEEDDEEEEEWD